jgi:Pyruvate/2-oxoacid:ferredoxin oxidoreductase delta subunit
VIINLPKLKTHNLTAYTGAIKNMFGVVPGFYKAKFHVNAIRPRDLAELLVDVFAIARPVLNIMDAVTGMEGNGPAGGHPRKLGAIIVSSDGVALDAVSSYLIGFDPLKIETTAAAAKRGLGQADLAMINVIGEQLEQIRQKDWQHSLNKSTLANLLPEPLFNLFKPIANQLRINPEINQEKCTQCLVCVKNCPVKTIDHDKNSKIVSINLKNCINCFCCPEMCEYQAIDLKPSWLVRLLRIPI